jgi:hypothetical protein
LSNYRENTRERQASPKKFDGQIERLNEFFVGTMLARSTRVFAPRTSKRGEILVAHGAIWKTCGRRLAIMPVKTCIMLRSM